MKNYLVPSYDDPNKLVKHGTTHPEEHYILIPEELQEERHEWLTIINGEVVLDESLKEEILEAEAVAEQIKKNNMMAEAYLASTDWYVIREMDTGTPMPEDIKQLRIQARFSIVR